VPGKPVIAEAECYRITRSVAFTRAFAHQGDPKDPVAAAAGTFMLGTKGEVTRPQSITDLLK
jgi:acyl-coenzyme A thioesterase PaaI-like protein